MSPTIAYRITLLAMGAFVSVAAPSGGDVPASPSPAARATPGATTATQTRETLATVKPMSEDKRVKTDDIDSVMKDEKIFFLDVREPKELQEFGSYEGYVNIPMSQLESRLGELPRDRPILTA